MEKKLIYKVFRNGSDHNGDACRIEYAYIYEDGSVEIVWRKSFHKYMEETLHPYGMTEHGLMSAKVFWEHAVEDDNFTEHLILSNMETYVYEARNVFKGVDVATDYYLTNVQYPKAYDTLCFTTKLCLSDEEDLPPYNNSKFDVEYYGEGKPWEPDLNMRTDVEY